MIFNKIFATLLCTLLILNTAHATDQVATPSDIKSLISTWQKDQHLYVKGDIKISPADLNNLETWLTKNAKNWTIILMRNANGEKWTDSRGSTYYGMDAVENAISRGLTNKTQFSNLTHTGTNQRNGAIFILFLEEKKFSYYASDLYDTRHLGDASWQGHLDAKAINAMRNGGRIIDAVKDTVTSIDTKLRNTLDNEVRQRAQQQAQADAAKLWVKRESEQQNIIIDNLQKELTELQGNKTTNQGNITHPKLNDWREMLQNAQTTAKQKPFIAKSAVDNVKQKISQHQLLLKNWHLDKPHILALQKELDQFTPHPAQDNQTLEKARDQLKQATLLHSYARSEYRPLYLNTQNLYTQLAADKAEHKRIDEQKKHEQTIADKQRKIALTTGGSATGLGLIGLGIYSNRRRRKQKALAEELYTDWKAAMKARIEKLFKTMDRAGIIVGSERDLPDRGYQGETLSQSINAIRNIDKAFILTSSVDTTLEKAKNLIYPENPIGKTTNIFRRARYDHALELLERKPLQTDPAKETMKVAQRGEDTMLGDKTKADKVKMTFTQLIAEFDNTLKSADTSLDLVEHSWETIASRCETLSVQLEAIQQQENTIEKAAKQDGLYQLNNLFDLWLPKSREHHENGIKTGKHDPVLALQTHIHRADTMAEEMQNTLTLAKKLRKTELKHILKNADQLKQLNRNNQWIFNTLSHLDERFETIAKQGSETTIADNLNSLSQELLALKPKTTHATKIANYTTAQLPNTIAQAQQSTQQTREDIAAQLNLSPAQILKEHQEWNPDIILTDAELFRIRAQDMLDQGHISQAQQQSDLADKKNNQANTVVSNTLLAHQQYSSALTEAKTLSTQAEKTTHQGITIMGQLTQNYHSNALLIDPTDPEYGRLTEVEEALLGSQRQLNIDIDKAQQNHAKGFVLTARHRLSDAKSAHHHINGLHTLISNRLAELKNLEQKNTHSLKSLTTEKQALGKTMPDHRTTPTTQQYYQQLQTHFKHLALSVQAPDGESNPFKAATQLTETKQRVKALETQIQADREVFAAAESLAQQLLTQHKNSQKLTKNAQQDGIPDSRQTTEAITLIRSYSDRITQHINTLKTPHTQWQNLYRDIQKTGQNLATATTSLKHELQQAQQALASIQTASSNVSAAMHWSGSYGVRISGSYGKNAYQAAHEALNSGHYQQASSLASQSINAARSAIASADARVASIRRARAAEQRQRSINRRSSRSGISFGSRSSSSSSSRRSTSSSRSNSGFSRSGW